MSVYHQQSATFRLGIEPNPIKVDVVLPKLNSSLVDLELCWFMKLSKISYIDSVLIVNCFGKI